MNCPNCRTSNQNNAKFCANCGNILSQSAHSPYQAPSAQQLPQNFAGTMVYAGFWKRFVAYIIDWILINFIFGLGTYFLVSNQSVNMLNMIDMISDFSAMSFSYYLLAWAYFALQESSSAQATIGKRILGIKVADLNGQRLSLGKAAGRQLAGVISSVTLTIGYLMAGFTGRKQALHDIIAGTVVVNKHALQGLVQQTNAEPPPGMSIGAVIGIIALVLIVPVGGIIAAVAIPAYHDYTVRAQITEAYVQVKSATPEIVEYALETGYWPSNFEQAGLSSSDYKTDNYHAQILSEGIIAIYIDKPYNLSNGALKLTPELINDGSYKWHCEGVELELRYVPRDCRE